MLFQPLELVYIALQIIAIVRYPIISLSSTDRLLFAVPLVFCEVDDAVFTFDTLGEEADRLADYQFTAYAWILWNSGLAETDPATAGLVKLADWNWEVEKKKYGY